MPTSESSTPSAGLQPGESGNGWRDPGTPNSDFSVLKAKLLFILSFIHGGEREGARGEQANVPAL